MRVVLTGIGVISPLGNGILPFWDGLLAGKTGIRPISKDRFDASSFPCRIAGQVDFDPAEFLDRRFVRYTSFSTQLACAAFLLARKDAGMKEITSRADVIVGSGVSNLGPVHQQLADVPSTVHQFEQSDPLLVQKMFIGGPASGIALLAGAQGLVTTVSTACSSGNMAVGLAYQRIKTRQSQVIIGCACDAPLNHLVHTGFCSSGHYTSNNDPEAQRPFDARREKCAPGEGATVFILESDRHARARGARIYCEIIGFEAGNENTSELYFLDKSANRWGSLIGRLSRGATHLNAHGISDATVDKVEAAAILRGFGRRGKSVVVTSIKGSVGSGLAAAGGFQIAAAAKTIETGLVPPTRNYAQPDPELGIRVASEPIQLNPDTLLVNSHGVTGYNSVLKLGKYRL